MASNKAHPLGFCTCKHVLPSWRRPRHWSAEEVSYLEEWYGRMSDDRLAEKLGRPVLGIRLKAKRLRIRKRNTGLTATRVARIFGVDPKAVVHWIEAGLLRGRRGYAVGPNRTWHITGEALEEFIREHGQYVDVGRMPEGWWRGLAEQHRWLSLVEIERLTGESPHRLRKAVRSGTYRGAMRGPHLFIPASELPRIEAAVEPWRRAHITILMREREERLKRRRDKRKGVGRYGQAA
jgi:hypothetical protein